MKKQVWEWREAIQISELPSTTRLVLFNLSCYLNSKGGNCFPSVDTQSSDTGLSKKAVITHLQTASEAGFIVIKKHGFAGQKWSRNEYFPAFPEWVIQKINAEINESIVIQDGSEGGERGTPPSDERRCTSGNKAVNDVHPNSTTNLPVVRKNNNKKKSEGLTLAQWEEKFGSPLCVDMLSSWIKDARADADAVRPLIAEFREKVTAQGRMYADFAAAFKVWLRSGWLSKPLMTIQQRDQRKVTGDAEVWDRGTSL